MVLASGIGVFRPKKLDAWEVEEIEGKGISFFVTEKKIFRDKEITMVGGGDSAIDWALNFLNIAEKIILIHKRGQFHAHAESIKK